MPIIKYNDYPKNALKPLAEKSTFQVYRIRQAGENFFYKEPPREITDPRKRSLRILSEAVCGKIIEIINRDHLKEKFITPVYQLVQDENKNLCGLQTNEIPYQPITDCPTNQLGIYTFLDTPSSAALATLRLFLSDCDAANNFGFDRVFNPKDASDLLSLSAIDYSLGNCHQLLAKGALTASEARRIPNPQDFALTPENVFIGLFAPFNDEKRKTEKLIKNLLKRMVQTVDNEITSKNQINENKEEDLNNLSDDEDEIEFLATHAFTNFNDILAASDETGKRKLARFKLNSDETFQIIHTHLTKPTFTTQVRKELAINHLNEDDQNDFIELMMQLAFRANELKNSIDTLARYTPIEFEELARQALDERLSPQTRKTPTHCLSPTILGASRSYLNCKQRAGSISSEALNEIIQSILANERPSSAYSNSSDTFSAEEKSQPYSPSHQNTLPSFFSTPKAKKPEEENKLSTFSNSPDNKIKFYVPLRHRKQNTLETPQAENNTKNGLLTEPRIMNLNTVFSQLTVDTQTSPHSTETETIPILK